MPRRSVVHLMTCVLALVTAITLVFAGAAIGDVRGFAPSAATEGATEVAVRAFYDAVNRAIQTGDASPLDTVVSPAFVVHGLPPGSTPDRPGLARYLTVVHATAPGATIVVEDLTVVGDRAMARLAVRGAEPAAFLGVPLDGVPPVWAPVDALRVVDGLVVEHRSGADGLVSLEPLRRLPLGTRLPTRPFVLLERLVVPPGQRLAVDQGEESHLIHVETGVLTASLDPQSPKPGLLAARSPAGRDSRATEIAPGSERTLSPGDLLAISATARYAIRNDSDTTAEAVIALVVPRGFSSRSSLRADPAYVSAGSGTLPLDRHGSDVDPAADAGAGPLAGVAFQLLAGGPTTDLPAGPTSVGLGRVSLAPGAEVRLRGAAGPTLLGVEAGALAFATRDGDTWATRGPYRMGSKLVEGTLAVDDGLLVQPGTGLVLHNPGDEPVVVLVLAIQPEGTASAPRST